MRSILLARSGVMVILVLGLLLPVLGLTALAAPGEVRHSGNKVQADSENTVTILALDMSGSMSTNDPEGLRCSAVNAFLDLSGPGNFIGLVGLAGNGTRGGKHNFEQAQVWADPQEVATPGQRQALQNTIKEKSQSCRPNGSTPTYDALSRSLQMLQGAAQGRALKGSVVLLTDGVPDPDTRDQVNVIQRELLPEFKRNGWSIDTIALGGDNFLPVGSPFRSFHAFLSGISNATSGKFYSDAKGVVEGRSSPINIAPFFVDIFARRNQRTVGDDISLTRLNNETKSRAFEVTNYTDTLDVVVLKDQPGMGVTLKDPGGNTVKSQAGVFASTSDPYYALYSITRPRQGSWSVEVKGSGQFLMKSLKVSSVQLASLDVSQTNLVSGAESALAIGQPIAIKTNLTYQGEPITDTAFTLNGRIGYNGVLGAYAQNFALNSEKTPGTYTGTIVIPENAPPGSYDVTVNAYAVSQSQAISSQLRTVRIEYFPEPLLQAEAGQRPTREAVNLDVVRWDPVLRAIYSLPLAPVQWLSQWPLQGNQASAQRDVAGQILLRDQPYNKAHVQAEVIVPGERKASHLPLEQGANGRFSLPLPVNESGTYRVNFRTSGSFADSHGDFGVIQRTARVNFVAPSWTQTLVAWSITALYVLVLLALFLLVRFCVLAKPFGGALVSQNGEYIGSVNFARARRGLLTALWHPNLLRSKQAGMPAGLRFHFKRGKGIEVEPEKGARGAERYWKQGDGMPLPRTTQEISELRYQPDMESDREEETTNEVVSYQLRAQLHDTSTVQDDHLIEEVSGSDERKGKKRQFSDNVDSYAESPPRKREKPEKRGRKQAQSMDDYDW